jgi:hypothetical protein
MFIIIIIKFGAIYSKPCLKRNAIVPVFFPPPVFTGFRFTKGSVLIKQSTKKKYDRVRLQ